MKKIVCLFLSIVLCFISPFSVLADTNSIVGDNPLTYLSYVFNQLGCVVTGNFEQAILNDERLQKYVNGESQFVTESKDEKGQTVININQTFINDVKETVNDNIYSQNGYKILPHIDIDVVTYFSQYVSSVSSLLGLRNQYESMKPVLISKYSSPTYIGNYYVCIGESSQSENIVFYMGNSGVRSYDLNTKRDVASYPFNGVFSPGLSGFREYGYGEYPGIGFSSYNGTSGRPIKLFNSSLALYQYLTYQSNCYVPSSGLPSFPGGLSVPKSTFEETDWRKLNQTIYDAIQRSLDDARLDELTAEKAEEIISEQIQKLLDAMGSINEGQLDGNQSLDEILAQITAEGTRQSGWLAKIFTLLDEKLNLLISGGGSGSSSGSQQAEYGKQLDAIISELEKSNDILGDIESNTGKIILLLGVDTAVSVFDLISQKFSESTDTAKTKFPTSIPWDVIAIVEVMKSDPVAPVFDIPVKVESLNINESIHIDLTGMDKLSKLSRTLLSLTFILFLATLTRKMFFNGSNGGD